MRQTRLPQLILQTAPLVWLHMLGAVVVNAVLYAWVRQLGFSAGVGFAITIPLTLIGLLVPLVLAPAPAQLGRRLRLAFPLVALLTLGGGGAALVAQHTALRPQALPGFAIAMTGRHCVSQPVFAVALRAQQGIIRDGGARISGARPRPWPRPTRLPQFSAELALTLLIVRVDGDGPFPFLLRVPPQFQHPDLREGTRYEWYLPPPPRPAAPRPPA